MSNPSVEFLKIPSKLEPQLWVLPKSAERSQSHFSAPRPRPPRVFREYLSFLEKLREFCLWSAPAPQHSESSRASAGSADAAGSRQRNVGRSFHVKQALCEDLSCCCFPWNLFGCCPSPRWEGGNSSGPPRPPLWKLLGEARARFQPVPRWEAAGLPKYKPHLHCTPPAAR